MRIRALLILAAGMTVSSVPAALAVPPSQTSLYLCGAATIAERVPAGNSSVFKSGPVDVSAGETKAASCDDDESNGSYTWSLDHATSNVSRGNGRQHGTEHGAWSVTLNDGTQTAGIYNGRILLDTCSAATSDGDCYSSRGNVNSGQDDSATEGAPVAHWVGKYATTITATDCGDDDGCQFEQATTLTYRQVGGGPGA